MISTGIVIVSLVLNLLFLILMFKGVYVPKSGTLFLIALITILVYLFAGHGMKEKKHPHVKKGLIFSLSIYLALIISSIIYHAWKLETIVSAETILKLVLLLTMTVVSYLNFVYIRAEISYKRKRGNQRIQKEQPNYVKEWFKRRKRKQENEISIVLGYAKNSNE